MGNQTSRFDQSSSSTTINDDPCLENMRQWHTNEKDEPYKRQYPLPTIANDHNRVKPRKQSSPAAVTMVTNNKRRPLSRFFSRQENSSSRLLQPPPRNNSYVEEPIHYHNTLTRVPSIHQTTTTTTITIPSSTNSQPHYVHPLTPIDQRSLNQLFPYDNITESFSTTTTITTRPSLEISGRRLNNSNRNSLNKKQFMILAAQQQQEQQEQQQQQEEEQHHSYRVIRKRKYHQVVKTNYLLPCDEEEIDRLHLQHFMIRFAIQGNYLAPVNDVLRKGGHVLDIGCGPGSWSMEIAGEYPKSNVVGVDMTPIYPKEIKPTNCTFYQCNILNPPLPFEDNTFDYIFMRFMNQGVEKDQWAPLLSELIRILKPNGWIEWVEADVEIHRPGPMTHAFNQKLMDLMLQHNQDPHIGRKLEKILTETGQLCNINTMFVSCPGGQWAGKLGQLTMQSWKAYYQALSPLLCYDEEEEGSNLEYHHKLKMCWREADEYKTFENIHFSYAQKRSSIPPP